MSRSPQIQTAASGPAVVTVTERDLPAEVEAIRSWLKTHPSVTPNALSLEAKLGRNSLTSLLREADPELPTAKRLDKLYGALANYGFRPQPGRPLALSASAVEQLYHLSALGCALQAQRDGSWAVVRASRAKLPERSLAGRLALIATGHELGSVLTQAVKLLAAEGDGR